MRRQNFNAGTVPCRQRTAPFPGRYRGSLRVLAVFLLTLSAGGCGTFAEVLEAPKTSAPLKYLNPPLPSPPIPFNATLLPIQEWAAMKHPAGDLLCMSSQDFVNSRTWKNDVSHWGRQAVSVIRFHEQMNAQKALPPE